MFSEVPSYLEKKKCFEVGMNEIYGMQENNIDKGKLKIQITSEATSFPGGGRKYPDHLYRGAGSDD